MQIGDDVGRKSAFQGKSNGLTRQEECFYRVICMLLPVNYRQIGGIKTCFLTEKWLNSGAQAAERFVISCVSVNCEKCSCLAYLQTNLCSFANKPSMRRFVVKKIHKDKTTRNDAVQCEFKMAFWAWNPAPGCHSMFKPYSCRVLPG